MLEGYLTPPTQDLNNTFVPIGPETITNIFGGSKLDTATSQDSITYRMIEAISDGESHTFTNLH